MKKNEAILAEIKRLENEQTALLAEISSSDKIQLLKGMDDYLYEKHLIDCSAEPLNI